MLSPQGGVAPVGGSAVLSASADGFRAALHALDSSTTAIAHSVHRLENTNARLSDRRSGSASPPPPPPPGRGADALAMENALLDKERELQTVRVGFSSALLSLSPAFTFETPTSLSLSCMQVRLAQLDAADRESALRMELATAKGRADALDSEVAMLRERMREAEAGTASAMSRAVDAGKLEMENRRLADEARAAIEARSLLQVCHHGVDFRVVLRRSSRAARTLPLTPHVPPLSATRATFSRQCWNA